MKTTLLKTLLLALTVLFGGCAVPTNDFAAEERVSPVPHFGLYVEIEMFTDRQLLLFYDASLEWERLTDGRAQIEWLAEPPGPDDDGNGTVNWVLPERSHCESPPAIGCAFYGPPEKGIEFVDHGWEWTDQLFYAVALHELGHYLGEWEHSENETDIMYAGIVSQENLTVNDIRMWCQLTGSDSQACNVFR